MSSRRSSTSPQHAVVSQVMYDTSAAAPLALKYPDGKLMQALPAHRALIEQAAHETHTGIFIVCGARLQVYYTADGKTSAVPKSEPLDFFATFQRLQIEQLQMRRAAGDVEKGA